MRLEAVTQRISVVGMGYVGLCTAVGFANKDIKIVAVDKDHNKIDLVNKGIAPFHEPELESFLQTAIKTGYLKGILDIEEAILNTDITFITVGTPSKSDGSIDLNQIRDCTNEIGKALNKKGSYHLR